jgi:hypothetical protein
MSERLQMYMMEQDARVRIRSILGRLRKAYRLEKEVKIEDDAGCIEHHIKNIKKGGGGSWNESIASDYVHELETIVARPTKAYGHFI